MIWFVNKHDEMEYIIPCQCLSNDTGYSSDSDEEPGDNVNESDADKNIKKL